MAAAGGAAQSVKSLARHAVNLLDRRQSLLAG